MTKPRKPRKKTSAKPVQLNLKMVRKPNKLVWVWVDEATGTGVWVDDPQAILDLMNGARTQALDEAEALRSQIEELRGGFGST